LLLHYYIGSRKPKRKDLIVVIDDPVSSLDTRALNYSFNILRTMLSGTCQVFLLTHNLQFMNEARKWLIRRSAAGLVRENKDAKDATATLLLLDATQPGGPENKELRDPRLAQTYSRL
jgi:wobble nucleotide-excising tRNase